MKVHELAKQLNIPNKDLISALNTAGIKVKSHLSPIDESQLRASRAKVREALAVIRAQVKEEPQAAEKEKPVVKKNKTPKESKATAKPKKEKKAPVESIDKIETSSNLFTFKIETPKPKEPGITSVKVAPSQSPKVESVKVQPKPEQAKSESAPTKIFISDVKKAAPVPPKFTEVKKNVPPPTPSKSTVEFKKPHLPITAPSAKLPSAAAIEPKKDEPIQLRIPITVGALSETLKLKPAELIKALIELGIFANINQLLNEEIVYKVANRFAVKISKIEDEAEKVFDRDKKEDATKLKFRAPVVTMMGHVDHGKTSLLDAIRQTNVASGEAGYITQHIGAYMVDIPGKGHVTFLDTPGHEAFTAIRARGANVTDIVVLVVAADDGVMPQTIEAIDHAKAAGCPIVVAVNKSDLPSANPQRVMQQLQKLDLVAEEWGGKTIFVKVSAKTGDGIQDLLDMLLLQSEVMELKSNPDCEAQGTVLEARLTKGLGSVSTVLVQRGTLKIGDIVVAGPFYGRVRAMRNDRGKHVKEATLSYAVEVLGLSGVPDAGEIFTVVKDEKLARSIAEKKELEIREKQMKGTHSKHMSLQELHSRIQEGVKELRLIIKADVQGSLEGLIQTLTKSVSDKISIRVVHGGVGGVNESDVMLAVASDAIIIGFHVKADTRALELIEKEGIDARFYSIIYEAVEDVQKAMEGMLEPTLKEVVEGKVEIRKIFKSSKAGMIGGAMVVKGRVARNHKVRLVRDNIVIFEGKLASLKRFKDDVREVQEGYDCGIALDGFNDLREKDLIEAFRVDKIATKLA